MSTKNNVPSYRLHKQSGQAIVTLPDGLGSRRDILLGPFGTKESRMEYARVISEWEAAGRCLPQARAARDPSCNELMLAYWRFAEGYYIKNGQPTSQLPRVRLALKQLKDLYGHTPAKNFSPLALKAVRNRMVELGWSRGYVNASVGCIKRMFKWAVENELVPASLYHGLQAVAGLKKGRTEARETEPIRPVDNEHVEAVLPFVSRAIRAMIQVQRLSGARPGEVIIMRPCDIDRANDRIWVYRPESHKTEHHGITRSIFLGPQAQEVLQPFLNRSANAYLFCPREMMEERRAELRRKRKTKVQPSQTDRKRRRPTKLPGDRYSVDSYDHAITVACQRAGHWVRVTAPDNQAATAVDAFQEIPPRRCRAEGVYEGRLAAPANGELTLWNPKNRQEHTLTLTSGAPVKLNGVPCQLEDLRPMVPHWAPNQLRHAKATEIRREAGLDAARVVLGHRSPRITEVYAEIDVSKAAEVMERLG
jgi:integrase